MKGLGGSVIKRLLALVFAFTLLFLFKFWFDELWREQSSPPKTLFSPQHNPNKINQNMTCYCKAPQITPTFPNFTLPIYHDVPVSPEMCPFYFNFIRQDLKPWEKSGITLEDVERAKKKASFRLTIIDGRLFVEVYRRSFQTRDLFTVWGIAQLLRRYPGLVPDLDLMFNRGDKPAVYKGSIFNMFTQPPPLFHYCGSKDTFDIVFPDWSFWGWVEIEIPPWERTMQEIRNGNQQVEWTERDRTAYWKGNPWVSLNRQDLMDCTNTPNWNGRLYIQDWIKESEQGYKDSKLANQCTHRYKIYIEGIAWSVSLKYILACNSPTLLITPKYYDFFLRGLLPHHHYWPIRPDKMCNSIKFGVNWGNNHTEEAIAIGKAGSDFIWNELKMKYVYDYMFHVLREYAKLLKYRPTVTKKAVEYCSKNFLCFANEAEKMYMKESMVTGSSPLPPCMLGEAEE